MATRFRGFRQLAPPENHERRLVILVVDDEPQILRVMRASLPPVVMEVRTAADGNEALDEIGAQMPDIIILDLVMLACRA
jgi:CheY-like chemotaxis protein